MGKKVNEVAIVIRINRIVYREKDELSLEHFIGFEKESGIVWFPTDIRFNEDTMEKVFKYDKVYVYFAEGKNISCKAELIDVHNSDSIGEGFVYHLIPSLSCGNKKSYLELTNFTRMEDELDLRNYEMMTGYIKDGKKVEPYQVLHESFRPSFFYIKAK